MNLFKHLLEKNLVSYGRVIDWWLSEGKFEDWAKDDVGNLTKKLHLLQGFSKNRDLHYESAKRLSFPKKAQRYPQVWISKGSSEGRDWVRHIRNGIAHGNVTVRANTAEPIVEIKDYMSDCTTQTAYILIPLKYLEQIMHLYDLVDKRRKNQ